MGSDGNSDGNRQGRQGERLHAAGFVESKNENSTLPGAAAVGSIGAIQGLPEPAPQRCYQAIKQKLVLPVTPV
jgi:hypothetical protein